MVEHKNSRTRSQVLAASILMALLTGCGGGGSGVAPAPGAPGAGTGAGGLGAGPAPVNLGTAGNFAILTKAGVSNVPTSAITGNVGASPITAASMSTVTCPEVTGLIYGVDAAYAGACFRGTAPDKTTVDNAVLDMGTAYADASARTPDFIEIGAGNISGMTLPPGTYKWGTGVAIVTDVTLSGGPNDVWIFQVSEGLTQSSTAKVLLAGGALPKNIFWQAFGVVDVGTGAHLEGVVMSQTSITLKTGASANSRLLAHTEVVLDQNAVTQPAP